MTEIITHPVQDPTKLTLEFVHREVLHQRQNIAELIDANAEKSMQHYDFVLDKIVALCASVDKQFDIIERHRIEQKTDTQNAVQSALMAAKEAVLLQTSALERNQSKQDETVTKRLEQMGIGYGAAIENLKERVNLISGVKTGGDDMKASFFAYAAAAAAIVGVIAYFAGKG